MTDEELKQEKKKASKALKDILDNPNRPKMTDEEFLNKKDIPYLKYLKKIEKARLECYLIDTYHKDVWRDNAHEREIKRINKLISILEFDVKVQDNHYGVIINDKFIVSLSKNNWKIKGERKWEKHGKLSDFIKGTVLGHFVDGWDSEKGRKKHRSPFPSPIKATGLVALTEEERDIEITSKDDDLTFLKNLL